MARLHRLNIADQTYHVIQRGNNRGPVFFEKEDYEFFLELLYEYAKLFRCDIHAYVLMTNHVHLLVTSRIENGISLLMQFLGRRYVRYINKKYERTGTLWEGRFRSSVIEAEQYLLTCMRYIELNPLRARMVRKIENYPWSSYHRNAMGVSSCLITSHELYENLGPSPEQRKKSYLSLFRHAISQDDLDLFRQALSGGWATGGDKFRKKVMRIAGQRVEPLQRGGDRRSVKFKKSGI